MNCGICIAYLREKNKCPGCRNMDEEFSSYCKKCSIRNCDFLKKNKLKFCSKKCSKYPCYRLKNLDKRYRTKYGMSMLENLEYIDQHGIRKFIKKEKSRWACTNCNGIICVHKKMCLDCKR
jgi:hypothetical protein